MQMTNFKVMETNLKNVILLCIVIIYLMGIDITHTQFKYQLQSLEDITKKKIWRLLSN